MKKAISLLIFIIFFSSPCLCADDMATLYSNDFEDPEWALLGWSFYDYGNDAYGWGTGNDYLGSSDNHSLINSGWYIPIWGGVEKDNQYYSSAISYGDMNMDIATQGLIEFDYLWLPEVDYTAGQSSGCTNSDFPNHGFFYIVSENPFNDIYEIIDLFYSKREAINPVCCFSSGDTWDHATIDLSMVPYMRWNGDIEIGALGRHSVNFTFFYRLPSIDTTVSQEVFVDNFKVKLDKLDEQCYENEYFFPQFGYGSNGQASLESTILLTNLSDSETAFVNLDLWDANGDPFFLNLNGEEILGSTELRIQSLGTIVIESEKIGELTTGAVRLSSTEPLTGYITFGGSIGEAAVPMCTTGTSFTAPFYQDSGTSVGLALLSSYVNTSDAIKVYLKIYNEKNELVTSSNFELEAFKHEVRYLNGFIWNKYVNLTNFKGRIQIDSNHRGLSVLMLRQSMGKLSTISVHELGY